MIKKIIHISDLHVRTNQLHDLYSAQFNKLYKSLEEQLFGIEYDAIRIVLTGDIVHQKINISNEQVIFISKFFSELAKYGKLIIIPGNHDFLENNQERLDSITPIVELLNNVNIQYFKDSGVYTDENIKWVVYSLYQNNVRPEFTKEAGYFYVGLFHGAIQGLSTDLGYKFEDSYDRLNFVDLDALMCGDIHKRQVFPLPGNGSAVMIGSLIQQDFGETIKHHGYGIFDVEKNKYGFVDIESAQPFMHFRITDISDIENEKEELLNLE